MSDRMCRHCGGRATLFVEPVGEYDDMGWEQIPVCDEHSGVVLRDYLDELDAVQVSLITEPFSSGVRAEGGEAE